MPITLSGDGAISGLTSTGISAVQKLPAGSVLQVVTATTSTTVGVTTGTQTDTTLVATITPTLATSKILVLTSCRIFCPPSSPSTVILLRNSTNIQQMTRYGLTDNGAVGQGNQFVTTILDSPSTVSAVTYKVTLNRQAGSATVYAQLDNDTSTMTLMEIAV